MRLPGLVPLARHRDDVDRQWRWVWERLMVAWIPALDPWVGVGPNGTGRVIPTSNNITARAGTDGDVELWRAEARVDLLAAPSLMNSGFTIADYSMARERGNRAPGWVVGDGTSRAGTYMGSGSGLWERLLEPPGAYDSNALTFPLRQWTTTVASIASGDQRYYMNGTAGTSRSTTFAPSWGPSANLAVGSTDGALEWYHQLKCTMVLAGPTTARDVQRVEDAVRTQAPFRWRRRRTYAYIASGPPPIVVACGVARAVARAVPSTPVVGAVAPAAAPARARARSVATKPTLGTATPSCSPARATSRGVASTPVLGAVAPPAMPGRATARPVGATLTLGASAPSTAPARARGGGVALTITLGAVTAPCGIATARATSAPATALTGNVVLCGVSTARARSVPSTVTLGGVAVATIPTLAQGRAVPATAPLGAVTPSCYPARARSSAAPAALQLGALTPAMASGRARARAIPTLPLADGAWIFACGVGRARAGGVGATVAIGLLAPSCGLARALARAVPAHGEPEILTSRVVRAVIRGGHVLRAEIAGGHAVRAIIRGGVS